MQVIAHNNGGVALYVTRLQAGLTCGLLGDLLLAPPLAAGTAAVVSCVDNLIAANPTAAAVVGAAAGPIFLWGSQHGLYHLLFMPALLLEMEVGACTGA